MFILQTIALAALVAYSPSTDSAAPPMKTAADVAAFMRGDFFSGRRFVLEGTVVACPGGRACVLEDSTGRALVYSIPWNMPKPGDCIVARGFSELPRDRYHFLRMESFEKTGHVEPPKTIAATARQITDGEMDLRSVTTKGFVADVFLDEIDNRYWYMVLKSGSSAIYAAIKTESARDNLAEDLLYAFVEVEGFVMRETGRRRFMGPIVVLRDGKGLRVLRRPPGNPFDAPPLKAMDSGDPCEVGDMGLRRISGNALAAWRENAFLLRADDGRRLKVELRDGATLPAAGERIEVVGFPATDFFRINLSRAIARHAPDPPSAPLLPHDEPLVVTPDDILLDGNGKPRIQTDFFGRIVRMRGVVSVLPHRGEAFGRMSLKCADYMVTVYTDAAQNALEDVVEGATVEVTGACLLESENWTAGAPFPRIGGFAVVMRTPGDLRILARPPFWTSGKLLAVIAALMLSLAAVGVWNRSLKRIAERRGRELFKAEIASAGAVLRVEERTRLAMDLHDSLAQNLAAVAWHIAAAQTERPDNPDAADRYLSTADRMLKACRTELRQCLWDLKSEALEEKDFAEALRKTCEPVAGNAKLAICFQVPRTRLSDATAHSVLCVARELTSNAARHGHAENVRIRGEICDGALRLSVQDDGSGFDPSVAPGLGSGHFGLAGVKERIRKMGGTLEIASQPGSGTRAVASIRLPGDANGKGQTS